MSRKKGIGEVALTDWFVASFGVAPFPSTESLAVTQESSHSKMTETAEDSSCFTPQMLGTVAIEPKMSSQDEQEIWLVLSGILFSSSGKDNFPEGFKPINQIFWAAVKTSPPFSDWERFLPYPPFKLRMDPAKPSALDADLIFWVYFSFFWLLCSFFLLAAFVFFVSEGGLCFCVC